MRFLAPGACSAGGGDVLDAEEECGLCGIFSSMIGSIVGWSRTSTLFVGQKFASAPPRAMSVLVQTICQTVLLIAPLGALGKAKNQPKGPNHECSAGGNQKMGVFEYQLVTQNGRMVVMTNMMPLKSMENVVRARASSELVRSRSARPLSTRRRSLAHLAN